MKSGTEKGKTKSGNRGKMKKGKEERKVKFQKVIEVNVKELKIIQYTYLDRAVVGDQFILHVISPQFEVR